MRNEKPDGHGERWVAIGTIDMAIRDAVAKIAGRPLFRLLAERGYASEDGRSGDFDPREHDTTRERPDCPS